MPVECSICGSAVHGAKACPRRGLHRLFVAAHVALVAGLLFAAACSGGGCAALKGDASPEVAKRTYEGEQAACVATYATRAEIDACRATVRRLWGQDARSGAATTDGGS